MSGRSGRHPCIRGVFGFAVGAACCVAGASADGQGPAASGLPASSITLRGGEAGPAYEVRGMSDAGVRVRTATIPERVLSWDHVEKIEGPLAAEARAYMPTAEAAWRARARLERGDTASAEAIYEDLFKSYAGKDGPTAAAVAEGLMRCRMRRGAQAAAVGAWLAWIEAATPLQDYVSALNGRDMPESSIFVDPATGLVPVLPPIWMNTAATQAFARGDLLPKDAKSGKPILASDSPAGQLGALYRRAAMFEAGQKLPDLDDQLKGSSNPGIAFVANIVLSRTGEASERQAARAALKAMLTATTPAWQEVWIRVAIGRSLVRESGNDEQLLGLAEMLHVPARLSRINPYLTGTALAEAAVGVLRHGDTNGAIKLRQILVDRFPNHPALDWEPIRGWAAQALPEPSKDDASQLESLPVPSGDDEKTNGSGKVPAAGKPAPKK